MTSSLADNTKSEKLQNDPKAWKSKNRMTVLAVIIATIGSFGLGTVLTWSAIALKDLQETEAFRYITDDESSWIASSALLGALSSAPFIGFLISKQGRKKAMLLTALPFLLGWLLVAFAKNLPMIYIGRFITGFCAGSFTVSIPTYVSEISEDHIRGVLGTMMVLTVVCGTEFTYVIGAFVNYFWLSIICGIIPVILFISMLFMPESPRHLLVKNRPTEARKALKWLRSAPTEKHIEAEITTIENSIAKSSNYSAKFTDLFTPAVLKPIGISSALMFFGQLSGVNGVYLYTVEVFEDAGTEMDPKFASIIIGGCQVLAVLFVPFVLVETLGRKTLLLASEFIMAIGLVAFGTYFYLKGDSVTTPPGLGWLPLTSLAVIIIGYQIGMGTLTWVVASELLPNRVRALGSSTVTVFYWLISFLTGKTFTDMKTFLGNDKLYWLSAGICTLGFFFILFFVPETKGRSAEEMQKYFEVKIVESTPANNIVIIKQANHLELSSNSQPHDNVVVEPEEVNCEGFDNPALEVVYGNINTG